MIYCCPNWPKCDSYVGVHKGSDAPLGRMANAELRKIKVAAHAIFDPRWKDSKERGARSKAYNWLAGQLGLRPDECHIGMFDVEMCLKVIEVCKGVV